MDELAREDLAGRPGGVDPTVAHGDQLIGVAGGEVQVVEHHHDGGAERAVEVGEEVGARRGAVGGGTGAFVARSSFALYPSRCGAGGRYFAAGWHVAAGGGGE